ncbi:hypothetical protein LSH36_24g07005 [Paralvinella palmiformis]|uniref:CUB domain-containing protein n=1 Tax=Paralvinella palmiformis TaxID=53620 RepID=A0AAD9KAN5_9ANNE|nr:hypothetical protein LSH36_24g07005 [Paralvinella palmiformis]
MLHKIVLSAETSCTNSFYQPRHAVQSRAISRDMQHKVVLSAENTKTVELRERWLKYHDNTQACVTKPNDPITRFIEASEPQIFVTPGFNYSDPDGTEYPENTICQWSLYIQNTSEPLKLGFFNFSIEDDPQCRFDNVSVYDGPDDSTTPIAVLCGDLGDLPGYFTASNKTLFLRFESDSNGIVGKGFIGRAAPPIEDTACDGNGPQVFTEPLGLFLTKNYPVDYGNMMLVNTPSRHMKVEITFHGFDLAQNCNDDYLDAFDGDQYAFASFAATYSGGVLPARMTSVTNNAYLRDWSARDSMYPEVRMCTSARKTAPGASNPPPFGYESYALTNSAVAARYDLRRARIIPEVKDTARNGLREKPTNVRRPSRDVISISSRRLDLSREHPDCAAVSQYFGRMRL